eukprot:3535206-Rhodomonas_salina.1
MGERRRVCQAALLALSLSLSLSLSRARSLSQTLALFQCLLVHCPDAVCSFYFATRNASRCLCAPEVRNRPVSVPRCERGQQGVLTCSVGDVDEQIPAIKASTDLVHIKRHYFASHPHLNFYAIIPKVRACGRRGLLRLLRTRVCSCAASSSDARRLMRSVRLSRS